MAGRIQNRGCSGSQPTAGSTAPGAAEVVGEDRRDDEARQADADHGERHAGVVGERVLARRGDDAGGDADRDGDQHGDQAEMQRDGECLADDLGDLPALQSHAEARVAAQQVGEGAAVLGPDRLVEGVEVLDVLTDVIGDRLFLLERSVRAVP